MTKASLDLAVIGNGALAALVDADARIVWCCWPRLDGDPIFSALIDGEAERGVFSVLPDEPYTCEQSYLRNTPILRTQFKTASGGGFAVTDFAPVFPVSGRMHRPPTLVRRIEPLSGFCRLRVVLKPLGDYGRVAPKQIQGSNHISFVGESGASYRLTTDAPVSYIVSGAGFVLTRPMTLILHADETLPSTPERIGADFKDRTHEYWLGWVRNLNVPFDWQEAVIRAAITLQLCSFDETGAIVAALTTSIPESPDSQRNWDYRYCWIRDAHFTVQALNRVGASRTMEHFIEYITNVIAFERGPNLKPVYGVLPESDLEERIVTTLAGFRGQGPVRVGNAAAQQSQHDVYGGVVLAASQMFFDERLPKKGDRALFEWLEPLGEAAREKALTPDAGIWEYRGRVRVHTYSAVMCWVACDRLARIAERLALEPRAAYWRGHAKALRDEILARAWNERLGAFCGSLDGEEFDASVLLLHELGFVAADDLRFVSTVDAIGQRLARSGMLLRYDAPDDFGAPTVSFAVCTFWYVDALAAVGRIAEARALFEALLARRNRFGLLSEDIDPATGELWGNFPQTYSLVGIIISAMRLSRGWENGR